MLLTTDLLLAVPLDIEGLAPEQSRELALRRREALARTGRIELDTSAVRTLAQCFLAEFGEVAPNAVDAFYTLRDELSANIPDAEVIDALIAATTRLGGDIESLDIPDLARELRQDDDKMSHYSITDDAGHAYHWDPEQWSDNECAPGWNGERWEDSHDD